MASLTRTGRCVLLSKRLVPPPLHVCPLAVHLLRNKVPRWEAESEEEPQPRTIAGAVLKVQRPGFMAEPGAHTHACLWWVWVDGGMAYTRVCGSLHIHPPAGASHAHLPVWGSHTRLPGGGGYGSHTCLQGTHMHTCLWGWGGGETRTLVCWGVGWLTHLPAGAQESLMLEGDLQGAQLTPLTVTHTPDTGLCLGEGTVFRT